MSNTNTKINEQRSFTAEQIALMKQQYKKQNQLVATWHQFKKNKMAVFGLVLFAIMVAVALSCSFIFDYETDIVEQHIMDRFQGFSSEHILGTDQFGRDIFKRVLWGGRVSLFCGLGAVTISLVFGSILGAAAGFFGGIVDDVIMRFMDILLSIPETLPASDLRPDSAALRSCTRPCSIARGFCFRRAAGKRGARTLAEMDSESAGASDCDSLHR